VDPVAINLRRVTGRAVGHQDKGYVVGISGAKKGGTKDEKKY
jgi:hypothetical protein